MEQAKVKIDHDLLMRTLKEQGKTSREVSVQMGRIRKAGGIWSFKNNQKGAELPEDAHRFRRENESSNKIPGK